MEGGGGGGGCSSVIGGRSGGCVWLSDGVWDEGLVGAC